jgi:ferredoxin-NADP reductase
MVAGGSGVVPFLAMLAHHRLTAAPVEVRLLYSARTLSDVIDRAGLAEPGDGVRVTLALTRSAPYLPPNAFAAYFPDARFMAPPPITTVCR